MQKTINLVVLLLLSGFFELAEALSVNFISEQVFKTNKTFKGLEVGGLSEIVFDSSSGEYFALSDDKKNHRFYKLKLQTKPFYKFKIKKQVFLKSPGQSRLTRNMDPEALVIYDKNTLFISSEGQQIYKIHEPAQIFTFNQKAVLTAEWPVPPVFWQKTPKGHQAKNYGLQENKGFESLSLDKTLNHLWTATERPLKQDLLNHPAKAKQNTQLAFLNHPAKASKVKPALFNKPAKTTKPLALNQQAKANTKNQVALNNRVKASTTNQVAFSKPEDIKTTTPLKAFVRISAFNISNKKMLAQYAYALKDPKLSGLVALELLQDKQFISLERIYKKINNQGRNFAYLFLTNCNTATNVLPYIKLPKKVKPCTKKLLWESKNSKIKVDNLEGLTLGPVLPIKPLKAGFFNFHSVLKGKKVKENQITKPSGLKQLLILVSDNNFNPKQQKTQFLFFELTRSLKSGEFKNSQRLNFAKKLNFTED